MHHILGNKVLEYDVDDRGVIVDEREIDRTVNHKPNIADWVKEHMVFWYDMSKPVDVYVPGVTYANLFVNGGGKLTYDNAINKCIITHTPTNNNIVTIEWCMEHGIVPPIHARRSVDGTMILLHEDFVAPVLGDEEISSYLYDSNELNEILNSEVWTEMN